MKAVVELLDSNYTYLGEFQVTEDFPFHEIIRVEGQFYTRLRSIYDYSKSGEASLIFQYILTEI